MLVPVQTLKCKRKIGNIERKGEEEKSIAVHKVFWEEEGSVMNIWKS